MGCRAGRQVKDAAEPHPQPQPQPQPESGLSSLSLSLSLEERIRSTRNELHNSGRTVLFTHILLPVLAHGSHLIYAPDEVLSHIAGAVFGGVSNAFNAARTSAGEWKASEEASVKKLAEKLLTAVKNLVKEHWPIIVSFTIGVYVFHKYAQTLKCEMQNVFIGWADWNREMGAVARFFSISALMVVRLLVSNVFPFTSPAFAYLIAKSQPEGQGGAATFYLLACSMPAGALLPLLDTLARRCCGKEFLATDCASRATDYLPFSFWVRPLFMEPAFRAAERANLDGTGAATAAVLAGHFMVWAGPATTMHQRKFIPDIVTCILIQPLGLMEDVAVILATWAGETPQSQKDAQIALYVFMLLMNFVQYITSRSQYITSWSKHVAASARHLLVGALTLFFLAAKYRQPVGEPSTTTTLTTSAKPPCATEYTNVNAVISTVLQVSAEAVMSSILAKVLVNCFRCVDAITIDSGKVTLRDGHDAGRPLLA